MRRVHAADTTSLAAAPPVVWQAVADLAAYPAWWPHSVKVKVVEVLPGLEGSVLEIAPYGGRAFRCRVEDVVEGRELRFDYSGIYRGTGVWRLSDGHDGTTRVDYTIDLEIADRLTSLLSYVLPVARMHSGLMRDVFVGLGDHLADGASTGPTAADEQSPA